MSKKPRAPASTGASPYVPERPPAPRTYRDLCSTCSHKRACGSRSTPERPILFCELFEVLAPAPTAASVAVPPERPAVGRGVIGHKGLCVNCESRQECTMARPAGGIWHCEEYT